MAGSFNALEERRLLLKLFGFSLVELLTTIGILAILAGLIASSLAKAKAQAKVIVCQNNLRQLSYAFQLYLMDYDYVFPAANPQAQIQQEDWIYWKNYFGAGDPAYKDIRNSPIAFYIKRFETNLFLCPADSFLKQLVETPGRIEPMRAFWQEYTYSYTLNAGERRSENGPWLGMASGFNVAYDRPYFFKSEAIRNPSGKIMLAEERTAGEIRGDPFKEAGLGPETSGWRWSLSEPLTSRHTKKALAIFADGHAERVLPASGLLPEHCDPAW